MTHFYPAERLAAFIDGANLHGTARALGFAIDYKRLLSHLRAQGQLVRICYYTIVAEDDEEFSSLRPLVDWLDYNGFSLVTKRGREYVGEDGRRRVKGNMDVELAVDAITLAGQLDHVMLFSGNGDFRALVADLQLRGVRVSVVSTLRSQPPMAADELRRQADQFIDLVNLEEEIGRAPPSRPPPEPAARPAGRRRGAASPPGPDASAGDDC
jgi:uncharacterized LabA/DUF88 family protein